MTVDWRPDGAEVRVWTVIAIVVTVLGVPLFALPMLIAHGGGSIKVDFIAVVIVIALTLILAVIHEAIHGAVMLLFGARPSFGATLVASSMPAFYATSPGHRFTRFQFVALAAAPALLVSAAGLAATLGMWGAYLIFPLAAHLGGCVGDGAAIAQVLRRPRGTMCEDLKDGIRFHMPLK